MRAHIAALLFLPVVALTGACAADSESSKDQAADNTDEGTTSVTGDSGDSSDTGETDPEAGDPDLPNGDYLMAISLAPVGGLVVQFQMSLVTERADDGSVTITSAETRSSDGTTVSDVLVTIEDTPVAEDGTFQMDLGAFWLPPEYSPTGGDVEVAVLLDGQIEGSDSLCGTVEGSVVTFRIDLSGSTFGAVPWDERGGDTVVACGGGSVEDLPRLDASECPVLEAGRVTGFPSGGLDRRFELFVPDGTAPSTGWPVVMAYHGLGGGIADLLGSNPIGPAEERGMVVVVPQADRLGGSIVWDVVSDPGTNQDITFFDDLVTCLPGSLPVDTDRIYAAGISNGGLMASLLMANRSSVLASAAPWSGGVMGSWPEEAEPIPTLVVWGGEGDEAVDQDFHALNTAMLAELAARGSFVVACNHGLGHEMRSAWWPWTYDFLMDHPRGTTDGAYTDALPDAFPDFCTIVDGG